MYGYEEQLGVRAEGCVTDWNPKGYGFIMCTDGRRAYVHSSQCGGAHLAVGEPVNCIIGPDSVNPEKLAAFDVQRVDGALAVVAAASAVPTLDPEQRAEGIVHEWNSRGFGFIHFPDNKRAYVHNSACAGAHLEAGEKVSCLLTQDQKNPGKLMARDVQRLGAAPSHLTSSAALSGTMANANAGVDSGTLQAILEGLLGSASAGQPVLPADTPGEDGVVDEWNDMGGYGYLTMDDRRRVFIHRNCFGGSGSLAVGMRLRVKTKLDNQTPKKWCVDSVVGQIPVGLEAAAAAAATSVPNTTTHAALTMGGTMEGTMEGNMEGNMGGAVGGAVGGTVGGTVGVTAAGTLGVEGPLTEEDCVVTEWNQAGGYGFVLMDDKRRAFVHRNTFGGQGDLLVGMRLRVTTKPDPRNLGKWCVGEIIGELTGEPPPSRWAQGQAEDGIVAEWNHTGGYGFLNMDDGKRAYIHRNFFGGSGDLLVGMRLRVTTRPDPRNPGKFCVENVVSFGEAVEPDAKRLRAEF